MFKVVENPEIESLLNDNLNEVFTQIMNQWHTWVIDGEYIGGLEDFINDGGLESITFEIDDIEIDGSDTEYDCDKLYEAIRDWRFDDECDYEPQYYS